MRGSARGSEPLGEERGSLRRAPSALGRNQTGSAQKAEHQDAYDLLLRAQESMHNPSRTVFEDAEQLFERAIARDPQFAEALAWRAHWHVMRVGQGWSPDPARDTGQADYFADRAIECDQTEPLAFAVRGHVAAYLRKDFDLARACFET